MSIVISCSVSIIFFSTLCQTFCVLQFCSCGHVDGSLSMQLMFESGFSKALTMSAAVISFADLLSAYPPFAPRVDRTSLLFFSVCIIFSKNSCGIFSSLARRDSEVSSLCCANATMARKAYCVLREIFICLELSFFANFFVKDCDSHSTYC